MKTGCVILAGGKSSRMGKDKALLEFDGTNFIEKIAGELSFFEEKLIARGNNSSVTRLQKESWKIIPDIYPEHGPMGGIHAALKECEAEQLFCVSCDMPFITGELAKWLCSRMEDGIDAVIAVTSDGKYHPLCGIYRKELCEIFETHLKQDKNRLMTVLGTCNVSYVQLDENISKQLMNINTKSDYEHLHKQSRL